MRPEDLLDAGGPPGRDAELRTLATTLTQVRRGEKRALELTGPAGIGKTTLLRWVAGAARRIGAAYGIVRLPGVPPTSATALWSELSEALGSTARSVRNNSDRDRAVRTLAARNTITAGRALTTLAERRPVLLLIDDIQNGPDDFIEELMGACRLAEGSVLLVATRRMGEGAALTASADLSVEVLQIDGVDERATAEIAGSLLGGPLLRSALARLFRDTAGNPLFVAETARTWRDSGALVQHGGRWALADEHSLPIAPSLRQLISDRTETLPSEELTVARVLALIGGRVPFDLLQRATDLEMRVLAATLSSLTERGVLEGEGTPSTYEFAHPLFATAIEEGMDRAVRGLLHGRILSASRDREQILAADLARHADGSLEPPDDLSDLCLAAGNEAVEQIQDLRMARHWFTRAAELSEPGSEAAAQARRMLVVLSNMLPMADAESFIGRAIEEEPDPFHRARFHRVRANEFLRLLRVDDALIDLDRVIDTTPDDHERLEARMSRAMFRGVLKNTPGVALAELEAMLQGPLAEHERALVLTNMALVEFGRGDLRRAARLSRDAHHVCPPKWVQVNVGVTHGWMCLLTGDFPEAERMLRELLALNEGAGSINAFSFAAARLVQLLTWKGEVDEALDLAVSIDRLAGSGSEPSLEALTLGAALLEADEVAQAIDAFARGYDEAAREPTYAAHAAGYIEALARAGDLERSAAILDDLRARLVSSPGHWATVFADHAEALLMLARGEIDRAVTLCAPYEEDASPVPYMQGRILATLAEAHRRAGRTEVARERARQTIAIFETVGARRRLDMTTAWLRRLDRKVGGRPRSTGPAGLTPRELDVLRLVLAGRTNREIAEELTIALATAKKHVENVMAKSGVRRRVDLTTFAIRHEISFEPARVTDPADAER